MKVVILAGGLGTRIAEETSTRPKPMVEIGGRPILWHIMKHYHHFGVRNFVLCLGYRGDVIRDGWKSEAVFDALDLCLSCKGCKGDCPVNVDMATYKAEFLSHYYENRLRPRYAYAMGWVHRWSRLASLAPRVRFVGLSATVSDPPALAEFLAVKDEVEIVVG